MKNLLEEVKLAEEVGLDMEVVGCTDDLVSLPSTVLAAMVGSLVEL